jgi:hypothetical protein
MISNGIKPNLVGIIVMLKFIGIPIIINNIRYLQKKVYVLG